MILVVVSSYVWMTARVVLKSTGNIKGRDDLVAGWLSNGWPSLTIKSDKAAIALQKIVFQLARRCKILELFDTVIHYYVL